MRVTQSAYYKNMSFDQDGINKELLQVNKQIASGKQIQYGHEDSAIFADTMRLDNELTALTQVKKTSENAKLFSLNTDDTMNQMTKNLEQFKVKLIQSASDIQSDSSREALAKELETIRDNLINLANTSVNGKYLFAGSALRVRPVDGNGEYQGNDQSLDSFFGSGVKQSYNISGQELFLGDDNNRRRKVTTNVRLLNQTALHSDIMVKGSHITANSEVYLKDTDTIRDMVGDDDYDSTNNEDTHFYLQGRRSSGATFKNTLTLNSASNITDLLSQIGDAFGNTNASKVVDVALNPAGQIEVTDLSKGSSQIQFSMVAADTLVTDIDKLAEGGIETIDFNLSQYEPIKTLSKIDSIVNQYNKTELSLNSTFIDSDGKRANPDTKLFDIMGVDALDSIVFSGTDTAGAAVNVNFAVDAATNMKDYAAAIENAFGPGVSADIASGKLEIADRSAGALASKVSLSTMSFEGSLGGAPVKIFSPNSSLTFDRNFFEKDGSKVTGNASQIIRIDNKFATESTTIRETAGVTTVADAAKTTVMKLEGEDINGKAYDVSINLNKFGSSFTVNGTQYDILDANGKATPADNVTYKQIFDITSMVISDSTGGLVASGLPAAPAIPVAPIPAADPAAVLAYKDAIALSEESIEIKFDKASKIVVRDKTTAITKVQMALYDSTTDAFPAGGSEGSMLTFNTNDAITITDAKTSVFADLDRMIESARLGRIRADGAAGDPRALGVQNSLSLIDDVLTHFENKHTKNGAQTNSLQNSIERHEVLMVNTQSIRSEVLDTDVADAAVRIKQLDLNYQALLSTVSRVNSLSLVNYLR